MSEDQIDLARREFLKRLGLLGVLAGVGHRWVLPEALWAMAPASRPQPLVAQASGSSWDQITGEALQKLGGLKKFVHPGEIVVIKPNMSFDRTPEQGANVHPLVVRQVVALCLEAGAKEVKVFDHPALDPRLSYKVSGIEDAVRGLKDPRAQVVFADPRDFVPVVAERARNLKKWWYYREALTADRFINIAVAKHHSSAGLTMCLKNMMGAIGGNRPSLHPNLAQNIADMNLILRPDLHLLDATRIMVRNGPFGGRLEDVEVRNLVFAGPDPVALDAVGTTLFGKQPSDIPHILKAHQHQLGELDLAKIKLL
jgi:uncharacterized protein (DUF362 family)